MGDIFFFGVLVWAVYNIIGKILHGENIAILNVNIEPDNEFVINHISRGLEIAYPFNEEILRAWHLELKRAREEFGSPLFVTKNGYLVKVKRRDQKTKEYRKMPIVGATFSIRDSFLVSSEVRLFTNKKESSFMVRVSSHDMKIQGTPKEIFGLK